MNSRHLIPVKRCKVFESCRRETMGMKLQRHRNSRRTHSTCVGSAGNSFDVPNHCAHRAHSLPTASRPM